MAGDTNLKGCPAWEETILALAWAGETPGADFTAHLARCPGCQGALDAEHALAKRAREAAPAPVPQRVTDGLAREVFARTYRELSPGVYLKTTPVWASKASQAGTVRTKEGATDYQSGDYLVSNNEDGSDAYAVTAEKFESMYELDE